jgi:CubicO group peptidase (beta-lactamase class C family)
MVLVPLAGLVLACSAPPPAAEPLARPTRAEIDTSVRRMIEEHQIPALAIGIVANGEVVYLEAFGAADGTPVTPQSPFLLASVAKAFTGFAIMQLVDRGLVDLDAPVTTYLPWFELATPGAADAMTVRHLLNQTSGFTTALGNQRLVHGKAPTLENYVRALRQVALTRPVGARYEYSNTNFRVAGMIVEAVSGVPYATFMAREVFAPLGMNNSWAQDQALLQRDVVPTVGRNGRPVSRRLAASGTPSGHLVASAEDMTRWLAMHLNGGELDCVRLISAEALAASHAGGARLTPTSTYSTGWVERERNGVRSSIHNGGIAGHRTVHLLLPDHRVGVVILAALRDDHPASPVVAMANAIASRIVGQDITGPGRQPLGPSGMQRPDRRSHGRQTLAPRGTQRSEQQADGRDARGSVVSP